jgi:hypothetical protein
MSEHFKEIHAKLAPLVANRAFPVTFPQQPLPTWPAIRYTPTGGTVQQTSCGDADEPDLSIQIDAVDVKFVDGLLPLVEQIKTAMKAFSVPAVLENSPIFDYDAETKTHRAILSYTIAGSSNF